MGYVRLDMTTSKSLVAAHTSFHFLKIIFLSVTSLSERFWFSYCFLLSTDVCMYMKQQLQYLRFHFSFSRGAATRPLPWPHAVLWCRFELYSLTCWSTVLSAMCCHTLNVQSTVTTSCILPKKKTTVVFPSLYVSTKENTMHKLGLLFLFVCTLYFNAVSKQ